MTNRKIDADTVKALAIVRKAMRGAYQVDPEVFQALTDLDNADAFREVDEHSDELDTIVAVTSELAAWLSEDHAQLTAVVDVAWSPEPFTAKVWELIKDTDFYPKSGGLRHIDMQSLRQKVIAEAQRRDLIAQED